MAFGVLLCTQNLHTAKALVCNSQEGRFVSHSVCPPCVEEERLHGAEPLVALGARAEHHVADELALLGRLLLLLGDLGGLWGELGRCERLRVGCGTEDREIQESPVPVLLEVQQLHEGVARGDQRVKILDEIMGMLEVL